MKQVDGSLDQINIIVELAPFLKQFTAPERDENQNFRRYLLSYLNDLVIDLGIPAETLLDVKVGEVNNEFVMSSYQVVINGKKCRLPLPTIEPQEVKAHELGRSVAGVIHKNRDLVVSVTLCEKIQDKWLFEKDEVHLPTFWVKEFHEFLLELVHRCFRIDRSKGVFQTFKGEELTELNVAHCFEDAVSRFDTIAIKVFLGKDGRIKSELDENSIEEMFAMMQDGLFYELGILLPKVSIDIDETLEKNEFRVQLNDLRLPPVTGLAQDQFLVNDTVDRLSLLNITGEMAINPANGNECAIVRNEMDNAKKCRDAGLTTWGPAGFVVLSVSAEIRRNAGAFLSTDVVNHNLSKLRGAFPVLVDTAIQRFGIVTLIRILRDLLDEEISIRDFRSILESLLAINGATDVDLSKYIVFCPNAMNLCPVPEGKTFEDLDALDYSSCVRMSLKRYISHKYTRGGNTLVVYLMDPQIETRIRDIDKQPLKDKEYNQLIKAIFDEVGNLPPTAQNPVILTTFEVRKRLRNLIEKEFPRLAVLCYQELSPDMNIQPIARIALT